MPAANFHIIRKCKICGAEFEAKTIESVYCSRACSNKAYKQKQAQLKKEHELDKIAKQVNERFDYIKVSEAHALFGVCPLTIYRLIKKGAIKHVNLGKKQIRVSKAELMKIYPLRPQAGAVPPKAAKTYRLEPADCYTIGQIEQKFGISEATVYKHIRQYSIPTRQIGKHVYAPKSEIDNLYK